MIYRVFLFLSIAIALSLAAFYFYQEKAKAPHANVVTDAAQVLPPMPETVVVPLGLPPIPWPADNPYTAEKAELGRLLYFDKRLSSDHTVSCATCHFKACGFSDCKKIAVGIHDTQGTRHSPTIINAAYLKHLFWDGRADTLEEQCKGPIANPHEMTLAKNPHQAHLQCENRIKDIVGYSVLFKKVFGHDKINIDDISKAIATYERTILSGDSAYDRFAAGDSTALTAQQIQGMVVFKKSGCANCHGGFDFSDQRFLNIGVGMDAADPDTGRYAITHNKSDWGAFKVPTLRAVEFSAPYMHDGSLKTLEEVVDYYDKGGIPNKNLHPLMKPLHLSADDKKALVSFLMALNGTGWENVTEPTQFPQ
jgi:cytochrome c peroxidase